MSPPAIRPGSQAAVGATSVAVATVPAAGAVAQSIPDVKLIDDHLAVQAIIRAYQVRCGVFVIWPTAVFTMMPCYCVHKCET